MNAILKAGQLPQGVEHIVSIPAVPRCAEIIVALENTANDEAVRQAARVLVDAIAKYQHLETAHSALQEESAKLHATAEMELSAAVDSVIERAAAKKPLDAAKTWEAIDRTARSRRGVAITIDAAVGRLHRAKINWLQSQGAWLLACCVSIETLLDEHAKELDGAVARASALEGVLTVSTPPGSFSSELRRVVLQLSGDAKQYRQLAERLEQSKQPSQSGLVS